MANFKPLGGTSRNYLNLGTGEVISRRQYLKQTQGTSFEEIARKNKALNPELSALRPAKGRKSALKSEAAKMIAEARLEAERRKKEIADAKKAEKKKLKEIERAVSKKVRSKKVTKALLKPGKMGVRVAFGDYDRYLGIMKEAQDIGVVFSYSVGAVLRDEETGDERDAIIFGQRIIRDVIPQEELFRQTMAFMESKTYGLVFVHWFVHLSYAKAYAKAKKERSEKAKATANRKRK